MAKVLPLSGSPSAELIHAAFGQARAMELGVVPFRKLIQVTDGTFQFRRDPDGRVTAFVEQNIGAGYQFFTTGPTVQTHTDADGDDLYLGHSLKVSAVPDKDHPGTHKLVAKAIASTLEADTPAPGQPERWRFEPVALAITFAFPRKHVWQIEGAPEHQYFAKDTTGKSRSGVAASPMLVDSWSQSTQLTNLGDRGSSTQPWPSVIDVFYDVAPSLFQKGSGTPTAGPMADYPGGGNVSTGAFAPDADWYKRGAFVKVTHPQHGSRYFNVLTDISNRFYVYPAAADLSYELLSESALEWPLQSAKTAIPEAFVQRADAPLPTWCRSDPEEARESYRRAVAESNTEWSWEYLVRKPQYRWAFNSTCTKACAVVFEDIPGIPLGDAAHTIPERGDGREVTESLPGLVELGLHISITGPNPGDFTFSLSLDRELQATVTKEYVMAADYAWVVRDGATKITDLDDLILMTGAIYHTSDERQTVPSANNVDLDLNALKGVVTVRNHTQASDIRAFLVSDTNLPYAGTRLDPAEFRPQYRWVSPYYEALGVIVAYDLRILAFVVQQRLIVQDLSGGIEPFTSDRHQGVYKAVQRVLVYAHNVLAQEKVMDPDSPLNAQLVDVFGDTSADGLFRFPVDEVGEYRRGTSSTPGEGIAGTETHMYTAYRSLDILRVRFDTRDAALYWYGPLNAQLFLYGGSINAGPFLYYSKIAGSIRVGSHEAFSVHPNGSWSITTAPFYYYSGAGTDLDNKYPFFITRPSDMAEQIDLALMKQAMVDIISMRVTSKTGAVQDVRGTHLAAINQAFGKTWTEQDFMCEFALHEEWSDGDGPLAVPTVNRYLIASSKTPGADDNFLVYRNWSHLIGDDVLGAGNPVYLDPRATGFTHQYSFCGPVLRGASLFY